MPEFITDLRFSKKLHGAFQSGTRLPLLRREFILGCTADRTDPVLGKFLKRRSLLYPRVGIAYRRIIDITADAAYISSHDVSPFSSNGPPDQAPLLPFFCLQPCLHLFRHRYPEVIAPREGFTIWHILHSDPLPRTLHLHFGQYLLDLFDRLSAPTE